MVARLATAACAAILPFLLAAAGPTAASRAQTQTQPTLQRALLDQYCIGCHSQRARAAGLEAGRKLTLDDADLARVSDHPEIWEPVVRKLRAGMMPPANSRRPDKPSYTAFI